MDGRQQGPKFSEQVAALESEVRSLRQNNAKLAEDNKAAATMIRNKDRELDAAALRVEEAERVMIMNGVSLSRALPKPVNPYALCPKAPAPAERLSNSPCRARIVRCHSMRDMALPANQAHRATARFCELSSQTVSMQQNTI